jgi:hypothetical protein
MQGDKLTPQVLDKLLVALLLLGLIVYLSTRPTWRLRSDAPPEFLVGAASGSEDKRGIDEKVGRAYWYCALTVIQAKYGFGEPLPLNPPPEFKISATDLGANASRPATRNYYWQRLRLIWYQASTWKEDREFNLRWLMFPVKAVIERLRG